MDKKNKNMIKARMDKKDEFYTQLVDIEKEMISYVKHDPDVFRGKTILLPCDDPERSNFTKFFVKNFNMLGLKRLISTSYNPNGSGNGNAGLFSATGEDIEHRGRIFTMDTSTLVEPDNIPWEHLQGDGDFRSEEVTALRDEADMVITNPPFSLFRDFVTWCVGNVEQYSILGNMNAVTSKQIFPLFKNDECWYGSTIHSGDREFEVPADYPLNSSGYRTDEHGVNYIRVKGVRWFTNIQHGFRHEQMNLLTMEDNKLLNNKIKKNLNSYVKYDNYDAIEVPVTAAIPSDYDGMMGVPITFLDKYNPEQFEILGIASRGAGDPSMKSKVYTKDDHPRYNDLNVTPTLWVNGELKNTYARILIKHKAHQ